MTLEINMIIRLTRQKLNLLLRRIPPKFMSVESVQKKTLALLVPVQSAVIRYVTNALMNFAKLRRNPGLKLFFVSDAELPDGRTALVSKNLPYSAMERDVLRMVARNVFWPIERAVIFVLLAGNMKRIANPVLDLVPFRIPQRPNVLSRVGTEINTFLELSLSQELFRSLTERIKFRKYYPISSWRIPSCLVL